MDKFCQYFIQFFKYIIGAVCLLLIWPLLLILFYFMKNSKSTWGGDLLSDEQIKEREEAKRKEIIEHAT